MSPIQIGFILFTFLGPALLWWLGRGKSPRFAQVVCWGFATPLVLTLVVDEARKLHEMGLDMSYVLPMQLCDWALIAVTLALVRRGPLCFEIAYFWGIAGTAQALFTPALDSHEWMREFGFFLVHSSIPAGVFWLMLAYRMRPRPGAFWRVMLWSEIYLVTALLINAWTGGNYGFLSSKPGSHSLLDALSDHRWLYILEINLLAVGFFILLDLPWQWARHRENRRRQPKPPATTK